MAAAEIEARIGPPGFLGPVGMRDPSVRVLLDHAILRTLARNTRSRLEVVYAEAAAMLEESRALGGPGAFISTEDLMEEVREQIR